MNQSELRIAAFGDVHLGHPRTTTEHILKTLEVTFPDTEETGRLDCIWIEGDLFDRNLHYSDPVIGDIQAWMGRFLRMCKRRDIVLRVLEGTPSHDWCQSVHFAKINEQNEIGADLKYVKTLSIEYIERFGIHVLYIPDEWKPDPDDIWKDVQEVLRQHQLTQVDFTVMHGAFNYQLPNIASIPTHLPERYLEITKHYVFIGHIHLMSVYDRILAAGSIERLSQGEEGPKGHWRVTVRKTGSDEVRFVENTRAMIYRTIDCVGLPLETALEKIEGFTTAPDGSFFRISAHRGDPILQGLEVVKARYPQYRWSTHAAETDVTVQKKLLVDTRNQFTQIHIGPANIRALLMERVKTMTEDPDLIAQCERALEETL